MLTSVHTGFCEIQYYNAILNWSPGLKLIKVDQSSYISFGKVDNEFIKLQQVASNDDAKLEFTLTSGSKSMSVGLYDQASPSINYLFQINDQETQVFVSGDSYTDPIPIIASDILKIEKCGSSILFYKNNVLLYAHCNSNTGGILEQKTILSSNTDNIKIDLSFDSDANDACSGNIVTGIKNGKNARKWSKNSSTFPSKSELLINIYDSTGSYVKQMSSFTDHKGRLVNKTLEKYIASSEYKYEIIRIK